MLEKLNCLFLFQNLIKEGNLKIFLDGIISLVISRDYIIVDIMDIASLKDVISSISIITRSGGKKELKNLTNKISDLKYFLNMLSKISKILVNNKKTFILKYKGKKVVIVGYDARGGILLRNIKLVDKLLLIKILNEFR